MLFSLRDKWVNSAERLTSSLQCDRSHKSAVSYFTVAPRLACYARSNEAFGPRCTERNGR